MHPSSTDQLLASAAIAVNVLGFVLVTWQIRQQALAVRGDTYTNLCGLSYEILILMADRPFLYPYFYDRKPLDPNSEHRVAVLCCCEMIANYCDNTALQRPSLPDHVWRRWRNFIREQIAASVVLEEFMLQYREWYSPDLIEILDDARSARQRVS